MKKTNEALLEVILNILFEWNYKENYENDEAVWKTYRKMGLILDERIGTGIYKISKYEMQKTLKQMRKRGIVKFAICWSDGLLHGSGYFITEKGIEIIKKRGEK